MPVDNQISEDGSHILALCGMPGSGKGEIANIAGEMSIPILSMGDIVRESFARDCPGRPESEVGIFADDERRKHGKDVWAKRLIHRMNEMIKDRPSVAIIDGLRSRYESDLFRKQWGDMFMIVAVHSSPRDRYERLLTRGRGDDPSVKSAFEERDNRELSWGLGDVISLADVVIINDEGRDDLRSACRNLLTSLGGGD